MISKRWIFSLVLVIILNTCLAVGQLPPPPLPPGQVELPGNPCPPDNPNCNPVTTTTIASTTTTLSTTSTTAAANGYYYGGVGFTRQCKTNSDCTNNMLCDIPKGVCVASCSDGKMNGNEAGVDCGGSCAPCPIPPRTESPAVVTTTSMPVETTTTTEYATTTTLADEGDGSDNTLLIAIIAGATVLIIAGISFALYMMFANKKKDMAKQDTKPINTEDPNIKRLRDYASENIMKGVSIEEIKQALIRVGWDPNTVENALKEIR